MMLKCQGIQRYLITMQFYSSKPELCQI